MYAAIFSRTYPLPNPPTIFAAAAADGFAGVQFNLVSAGAMSPPEIAQHARGAGIRLAALSGTYNMVHPDPAARAALRAGFAQAVEAARQMGAPVVTLCSGSRDPSDMWRHHPDNRGPAAWSDLRRELDFALPLAHSAGVKLAVEPEPGNVINDAATAGRLLHEVGSPSLGILLDAANLSVHHEAIAQATHLLADSILLAHAKNFTGEDPIDLPRFVGVLRAVGYDGALVAHGFPASEAPAAGQFLTRLIG